MFLTWLAVIFLIAATAAPQYYYYDSNNSIGAFEICSFGTCSNLSSNDLTDAGRGLQAMLILGNIVVILASIFMTFNMIFTSYDFQYQHLTAMSLMFLGIIFTLAAFAIVANNPVHSYTLGASFALNIIAWLLEMAGLGTYSWWVYNGAGKQFTTRSTSAPVPAATTPAPQRAAAQHTLTPTPLSGIQVQ